MTAPTPPASPAVEAGARALHNLEESWNDTDWEYLPDGTKAAFLDQAHVVIAALAAPPTPRGEEGPLGEGECVFTIRVGGERTHLRTNANNIEPDKAIRLAIAALRAEAKDAENCPYHTPDMDDIEERDKDWFKRNANVRDPKAAIRYAPAYFASECSSAIMDGRLAALSTPHTEIGDDARARAVSAASAWLRECSTWLLSNDLDMRCPMDTDPLDIADALDAFAATPDAASVTPDAGEVRIAMIRAITALPKDRAAWQLTHDDLTVLSEAALTAASHAESAK
jgi:hypothetical protein